MSYPARTEGLVNRIIGFIPFPRVLVLCELQSVSSRIWTRVAVSISCDDNHYTMGTSKLGHSRSISNLDSHTFSASLTLNSHSPNMWFDPGTEIWLRAQHFHTITQYRSLVEAVGTRKRKIINAIHILKILRVWMKHFIKIC